jgi:formate--tetrahydrofolate ligase
LVATVRALKFHGGVDLKALTIENLAAVERGFANLERHVRNIKEEFGLKCVVSINHFTSDTEAELRLIEKLAAALGTSVVIAKHWALGGKGAAELAEVAVKTIEASSDNSMKMLYVDRRRGAPSDHTLDIREVRLMAGAEFIVVICGDIMTMPGLPRVPSAEKIDISADGRVLGLF